MQVVSLGDNLHEMSKPFSGKNKKNIISLSSAKFAERVVNAIRLKLVIYNKRS